MTWTHSSRVGTTTSARGSVPPKEIRCSSGMPKPRVLPVPVRAWPIRSLPASAIGRVISWIANVRVMPTSVSARTIGALTPRSANSGLSSLTGARPASGSNSSVSGVPSRDVSTVDVMSSVVSALASLATRRRTGIQGDRPRHPLDARKGGTGGGTAPRRSPRTQTVTSIHVTQALSYP